MNRQLPVALLLYATLVYCFYYYFVFLSLLVDMFKLHIKEHFWEERRGVCLVSSYSRQEHVHHSSDGCLYLQSSFILIHTLKSKWQGCHVVGALGAESVLVKNIKWYHRELQPSNQSKDFPYANFVACTNTNPLSLSFFSRWLDGPKRKRKNSQCSVKSMSGKMSHIRLWCSCLELQQYLFPSSFLPEYITDSTFLRNTQETLRERGVFSCPVILLASTPASVKLNRLVVMGCSGDPPSGHYNSC